MRLIAHPHLLVRATSEQFLPARATFRSVLASESHWLQPMLVLTILGGPHQYVWVGYYSKSQLPTMAASTTHWRQ